MVFDNRKMEFNPSLLDVICTLDIVDPRSVQERDHMWISLTFLFLQMNVTAWNHLSKKRSTRVKGKLDLF